jgi:hypothetical protein
MLKKTWKCDDDPAHEYIDYMIIVQMGWNYTQKEEVKMISGDMVKADMILRRS